MALTRRPEALNALDVATLATLMAALAESHVWQVEARQFKNRFRNTLSALAELFR